MLFVNINYHSAKLAVFVSFLQRLNLVFIVELIKSYHFVFAFYFAQLLLYQVAHLQTFSNVGMQVHKIVQSTVRQNTRED